MLFLAKVFNRVPTYDELAREEYLLPQKIAPGIRREYTRFVQSPFYIRGFNDGVQKESLLDEVSSMQHLGGGLPTLPPTGGGGGGWGRRRRRRWWWASIRRARFLWLHRPWPTAARHTAESIDDPRPRLRLAGAAAGD